MTASVANVNNNANVIVSSSASNCFLVTANWSILNNAKVTFPAGSKVYFSGNIDVGNNGTLTSTNNIPGDLQLFGTSTGTPSVNFSNNSKVYAAVDAPTANIVIDNNGGFYGAVIGRTVKIQNNASVHYDTNLANLPGGPVSSYTNYSWNQTL